MLNKIKAELEGLGKEVFYGVAADKKDGLWDYIVFGREGTKNSGTSTTEYFFIVIVQEDFIEVGFSESVIEQMKSIGLKLVEGTYKYNYARKGSTDQAIEILTMEFYKSKKGC